ncbi:hypothetical protein [Paraglaciecola polaris]|nr:hypothetical protein [Paraglaciecola polaris]|tara:strand:- start:137 stop:556 length:420 start_codon:yes stop_codon:yes gene_type:complete
MKTLIITLLLLSFHSYAMAEKGFVVKIFPDKLTFPIDCETRADFQAKELSILYICQNSTNQNYFFNFRPNNIDIAANPIIVEIKESKFKSYTIYEVTDKDPDNGKQRQSISYCTKEACLDLVGDYEQSIKDSITSQLRG